MNASSTSPICVLASSANSCLPPDPNSARTALGILWSCLSVLFACTWVSVHPNVPGPNEGSSARRLWTKIQLMILALIAPELFVMWAVREWYAVRRLTEEYKGWTKTHAFFALMGGFALYDGTMFISVLRFTPLQDNLDSLETPSSFKNMSFDSPPSYNAAIPPSDAAEGEKHFNGRSFAAHCASFIHRVRKDELEDRNKSDSFAKLIAVGQTLWFVVQLCARWAMNLPVTELEVMTFAFAAMNVPIYFFWWNKPLGVNVPIRIQRDSQTVQEDTNDQPLASTPSATDGHAQLLTWTRIRDACSSLFRRVTQDLNIDDFFERTGLYGKILIGIPLWLLLRPARAIADAILADYTDIDDRPSEKVASFERTADLEPKNGADKLIVYGSAMIFGAIHCIAWTSQFPSDQEKILC